MFGPNLFFLFVSMWKASKFWNKKRICQTVSFAKKCGVERDLSNDGDGKRENEDSGNGAQRSNQLRYFCFKKQRPNQLRYCFKKQRSNQLRYFFGLRNS